MRKPMRILQLSLLSALLLLFAAAVAFADNRTENIDVFLVVDKSLSMESKIGAVKEYLDKSIIENMLIPGDYLVVITFYGKAQVLLSTEVGADKRALEQKIDSIRADGHWTDIGNALDELRTVIDAKNYPDHRRYFMLITDGIQEAPPTSKYYSPNGTFNHAFLDNTKTIQEQGWKIEILGIGTNTAAEELAKSVSGGFAQVSNNPTPQEIAQKAGQLLGVISLNGLRFSPVGPGGQATLSFKLSSAGYDSAQTVNIASVHFEAAGATGTDIAANQTASVPPNATVAVSFPVTLPTLPAGSHEGTVTFTFAGQGTFSPAVVKTHVEFEGFVQSYRWYFVGGGVLVLLFVLLAVFLVRRSAAGSRAAFNLTIEGDLKQSARFVLKAGEEVLIQDTPMGFRAVMKKINDPVARIVYSAGGLHFEVLKGDRLSVPSLPANVLGTRLTGRTNAGKSITFVFDPV